MPCSTHPNVEVQFSIRADVGAEICLSESGWLMRGVCGIFGVWEKIRVRDSSRTSAGSPHPPHLKYIIRTCGGVTGVGVYGHPVLNPWSDDP